MTNAPQATIEVQEISKWYGSVVAVNEVSFEVYPGVTGLLGPNGAGKTTLLSMMAGLVRPSQGSMKVLGQSARNNPEVYRRIGIMQEHDAVYSFMTGREFVRLAASLQGVNETDAVEKAISEVNLLDAQDRPIQTYSRGMRQRIRVAATLVHEPEVIILDEPLNGTDPRQRVEFSHLVERLASDGKTVLISSHILEEVEMLADRILLVCERQAGRSRRVSRDQGEAGRPPVQGERRGLEAARDGVCDDRPRGRGFGGDGRRVHRSADAEPRRASALGGEAGAGPWEPPLPGRATG